MTGWKQWLSGEVVEHTQFQTYLQDQVVQTYAGTAARSSALGTAVSEGMVSYLEDANKIQVYDGSAWSDLVAGTATYALTSGTASYATNSGTAVYSQTSGTATYATTSGTAVYATNAGTAVNISGTVTATQVSGTAVTRGDTGTVTNAMLAGSIENAKLLNSTITLNGTAVPLGGSATISGGTAGGFSNPMTTLGDLIVGGTAGAATRLAVGTAGQYLTTNGTTVSWGDAASGSLPSQTGNAGELLVTNGTSASWSNTVTANSTAVPALIAKGIASQATNFIEVQDSAGTVLARVNQFGNLVVGTTATGEIRLNGQTGTTTITSQTPATITLDVTAAPSQTANIQTWKNSGGTVLASIGSAGLLTANPATPTDANAAKAVGYIGMPQVALTTGGTTISASHAGDHIYNTSGGTVTIPANSSVPLEVGTTVVIVNGNNTSTIAITSDTLRQAGTTNTGSRTLAAYGMATLVKVASTTWYVSGNGIS